MEGFADLLTDAFSETSAPSFPDGDFDFENLNFDEKHEEDKTDNLTTKKDEAVLQEATGETAVLCDKETKDMLCVAENVYEEQRDDKSDEEDFKDVGASLKTPEEDYTSSDGESEQDGSVSGEDEEDEEDIEKPGDLLTSVRCSDEFCEGNKEEGIFAEGRPLAPECAENPQVRDKEQGEAESDEEVSCFGRVPEQGSEVMIKGAGTEEEEQEGEEEKQEDSSDLECEGVKIEQEENVLTVCFEQEVENPYMDDPAKSSLEFPCISLQNLQDLIAEVDGEECVEKMKDFSGEEHQEAGESFADYPSDFSSCEYVEDEGKNQESEYVSNTSPGASDCGSYAHQNTCPERAVTDITWMGSTEDADENEDGYLFSRDLEMEVDKLMSLDVAAGEQDREKTEIVEHLLGDAAGTGCDDGDETGESDSYSSSGDDVQVRRNDEELFDTTCLQGGSSSDDHQIRLDPADFISWDFDVLKTDSLLSEYLLTTEDTDKTEAPSGVNRRPAEDVNSYSVVQREDAAATSPSYRGSVDDSFFFDTEIESSGVTELGQLGDDEYEEERNWEQEQERIKAFYQFYDDSDEENGREGRQIKVQFCPDPLSQVIHYQTDSSDRDSLSSSTDREEEPSSAETSDEPREPDDTLQMKPASDPPNTQLSESVSDLSPTQTCTGKHKCLGMLKLMLTMGLATAAGLLMFWLVTDQTDWPSQVFFF